MRFGLTSTLPGAVTSPAGIASSLHRLNANLRELRRIGRDDDYARRGRRRRQRREPIEVLFGLPPQPAPASAQANTNKKLIGVVRMMIRKFPDQYRER